MVSEWTACKDKMPPVNVPVLAWFRWCDGPRIDVVILMASGDYWYADDSVGARAVTHWLPLPAPPAKED